jgi:hypothetical protein
MCDSFSEQVQGDHMEPENVLTQRDWTDDELLEAGFRYYQRRKRVVLVRELPPEEAPLQMRYKDDILTATAGYMICFSAGLQREKSLYDYHHWPVAPGHFADYYLELDDPTWKPTQGQKHLIELGCRPYYNPVGVWGKRLVTPQWIQGVEHNEPFEVPAGAWLLLGAKGSARGAPYWNTDEGFCSNCIVE